RGHLIHAGTQEAVLEEQRGGRVGDRLALACGAALLGGLRHGFSFGRGFSTGQSSSFESTVPSSSEIWRMMSMKSNTIAVAGGRLYYEIRGDGPLLLIMGAPMDAAAFAPLADALAADHTVVTHDPRGISRSTLDDPEQDSTPD